MLKVRQVSDRPSWEPAGSTAPICIDAVLSTPSAKSGPSFLLLPISRGCLGTHENRAGAESGVRDV